MNRALPKCIAIGLSAVAFGGLACRACSSDTALSTDQADASADAPADTRKDSGVDATSTPDVSKEATADAPGDSGYVLPDGVPSGWVPWTAWSTACPLYLPGPGAQIPDPIVWEPCSSTVGASLSCKMMKLSGDALQSGSSFWEDPSSGKVFLKFGRSVHGPDITYHLVVEADGPVHNVVLHDHASSLSCWFLPGQVADGLQVLTPLALADAGEIEGVIGGSIDTPEPSVLLRMDIKTDIHSGWFISSKWILQWLNSQKAWPWDGGPSQMVYSPASDPEGLPIGLPVMVGEDVFVIVGNMAACGVVSWNPQSSTRLLLRSVGDTTHGFANFGTDGTDMVWTYLEGAPACGYEPTKKEVWKAPYTLDPAAVAATATRLRSDVNGNSPNRFVVGHGYAARGDCFGSPAANSTFVVRLADGMSWVLKGDPNGAEALSFGLEVLGITKEELFLVSEVDHVMSIMRVRLDSLGAGTPAD